MAAEIKNVHIFESDGEFRVAPATTQLNAANDDEIRFVNHTDFDAVFYLGSNLVGDHAVAEIVKKDDPKKKKAKKTETGKFRISTYQVILLPSGKKAKANSDPVIIIDN